MLSKDDGLTCTPVDDGAGNRNNLLKVNLKSHKDSLIDTHVMDQATATVQAPEETSHQAPEPSVPVPAKVYVTDEDSAHQEASHEPEHQPATPETFPVQDDEKRAAVDTHITEDVTAPIVEADHSTSKLDASADVPPTEHNLFPHETLRLGTSSATSDPTELEVQDDDDDDYEQLSSPLFRHESMTPTRTHRQEEDTNIHPLFRHESMSPTDAYAPFFSGKSVRSNSATSHHSLHSHNSQNFNNYDIEDVNDPTLEKFPCERDGIFAQLKRTGSRVNRDTESDIEATPSSPALSSTRSLSAATSPSLARESSQNLGCIDEDEAEELSPADAKDSAVGLGLDKIAPAPAPEVTGTDAEPEKKDTTSKLSISPNHEPVNRGPLTPPLTPIDESQAGSGAPSGKFDGKAQGSPARLRKDNSTDHVASRSTSSSSSASADGKEANSKPASFSTWIGRISGGRAGPLLVVLPIIESVHVANILYRTFAFAVGALAVLYAVAGQSSAAKIREVVL